LTKLDRREGVATAENQPFAITFGDDAAVVDFCFCFV
jgi:hypothetical protein